MSDFRVGRGLPILSREPVDDLEGSSEHFLLSWVFSPIWNRAYLFSTLGHPDSVYNYPATHRTAPDPYRRLSDPKLSIGLRLRKIDLKVYIIKDFHSSIN